MDFISLFAGIGGFDLGFERAGMRCVAQVEWDAAAQSVLKRHYPHVQRFGDVRNVGRHNLPAVDLICGGFPCQDVSVAGRRAGLAGERSGLWFEFHRILAELRPRWVIIENVPGLLSSNGGRDFAVILRGLEELRYCVAWRVLDAQYFGVPQRRRRVFIVGSLGNGSCAEILFERESGAGHSPSRRTAGQGDAATIRDGASSRRNGGSSPVAGHFVVNGNSTPEISSDLAMPLRANDGSGNRQVIGTISASAGRNRGLGNENEVDMLIAGTVSNCGGRGITSPSIGETSPTGGGQPPAVAVTEIAKTITSNYGKQPDSSDSSTPGNYAIGQTGVRRLTPTECERLQGFPDGWTAGQSDGKRYRQLGNAVAVPVAEWIGQRIVMFAA